MIQSTAAKKPQHDRTAVDSGSDRLSSVKPFMTPSKVRLFDNDATRGVLIQALVLAAFLFGAWYLFSNAANNLDRLGMHFGFDFLQVTAGFNISWSVIPYDSSMTYWRVFAVGVLNTLVLSALVIFVGTILGTFVGILRLSNNPLISQFARWYVEIVRNVPLLIQVIFWFTVVFSTLPPPRKSYSIADVFFLNNRGLYIPTIELSISFWWVFALVIALGAGLWAIIRQSSRSVHKTGKRTTTFYILVLIWCVIFALSALLLAQWGTWSIPELKGFNFRDGAFLPASLGAAFVAMTVYRSAAIAETVRAGMQSIDRGQSEAAFTIGFSRFQSLRLILIPQAVRAIIPPMTNSWLAATKDSSLAVAIGFPELVSVFMQTSINQTGRALEIISMVMGFYIVISLVISYLLNKYNDLVQYKVR
ncbi:amino acid ABC transporter permease [Marinomonas mediterranea]|jgi:amine acid ABC transporter, permease protein, 3-TM region, His/Glu/Gln/Arg/opine family|uniref:Polar amino acid ABC transporter, inner membrane subunit n=1 Tax=Marinomonas mediterranea (strain ATCC 700492 / JCM 21426 / NBRC 103028 / MMB-1) TaxID=717774 RepID=F2JZT5_MARM1|nr:ABC transporter permease subunit [Marinomonas mediterranea]ADZ90939.1 polar amino acid ABC transporter, inner membrane subunit [Marinomonas mediterranea MMB-1]WCN17083.1 ABC transporter permease subunit [Marinomonas mediterranea MMB-1]